MGRKHASDNRVRMVNDQKRDQQRKWRLEQLESRRMRGDMRPKNWKEVDNLTIKERSK